MGLPRYNVASYLTLSYYRNQPSHSASPRTSEARPSVASTGSSHGVNSSTGVLSDGEKRRIDVMHAVRSENYASSPRITPRRSCLSRAIPFSAFPSRYHPLSAHLFAPIRWNLPTYLPIRSFLSRRICEKAPSSRAKLESGATNLV